MRLLCADGAGRLVIQLHQGCHNYCFTMCCSVERCSCYVLCNSRPLTGTLESEQPIHRNSGFCWWLRRSKNWGSSSYIV